MNRFTPIWNLLVDSSVWTEPLSVRVVWITMLALKDRDHVVRYTAFALAQRAHLSEAEVMEALKALQAPDKKRLEPQEFDGRRIEKVEDGWLVLNGQKYQDMMITAFRREYQRKWAKVKRVSTKGPGSREQMAERARREGDEAGAARIEELSAGTNDGQPNNTNQTDENHHS